MEVKNLENMQERLYRKGFDTHLNDELNKNLQAGNLEFALEHTADIGDDQAAYRLHFRVDEARETVYLNTIDCALLNNADAPGEIRDQGFPSDWLITANEMYRMLKYGDLVAVNKTLFNKEGEQYNTWLSLDLAGAKDEYNNYPVNSYHQNYYSKQPFDLKSQLGELAPYVKELQNAQFADNIEKSLKKANLVKVTIVYDGREVEGTIGVNPKAGAVIPYDESMKAITLEQLQQRASVPEINTATHEQQHEDVKKKPGESQRIAWSPSNQQSKGRSV